MSFHKIVSRLIVAVMFLSCLPVIAAELTDTEPNDQFGKAQTMEFPCRIQGTCGERRDQDFFKFTVSGKSLDSFHAELTVRGNRDFAISLFKDMKTEVNTSDYFKAGMGEYLTVLKVEPGEYFLRIEAKHPRQNEDKSAEYEVSVGAVPGFKQDEVRTALNKSLDYLKKQQIENGTFPGNKGEGAGVVGLAVQAWLGATCLERDDWKEIYSSLDYLETLYRDPETFSGDQFQKLMHAGCIGTNKDLMYEHGIALITFIESYAQGVEGRIPEIIRNGIEYLYRAQCTEKRPEILKGPILETSESYGGWRYTANATEADISVTGWQVIALAAAKIAGFDIDPHSLKAVTRFINTMHDEKTGSFGYRPSDKRVRPGRAGMGALSLQLLGEKNSPKIPGAIRYMFDKAPVWGGEYQGNYPFYYWYYGTRAAYLAGGEDWELWKNNMCGLLVRHQNPDGSWNAFGNELKKTSPVYVTTLGSLILEFCCGSVPIYMHTDNAPPRPTAPPRNIIEVAILNPEPGSRIQGEFIVKALPEVPDGIAISKITFYLDESPLGERTEPPWEIPADFGPGVRKHSIRVVAENSLGKKAEATVTTDAGKSVIDVKIKLPAKRILFGCQTITVEVKDHPDSPLKNLTVKVDGKEIYSGSEKTVNIDHDFGTEYEHEIVAVAENSLEKTDQDSFKGKVPPPLNVKITATATDSENNYLLDLEKSAFSIEEDGVRQEITAFNREVTPVSMVMVLDVSGSIRRHLKDVQIAASQFASQIQTVDRVAVISFSDSVRVLQNFTSDKALLETAINNTQAKGGTALYDSVIKACTMLKREKGRASVILLTDGKDEDKTGNKPGSRQTFEEAVDVIKETGVTVYSLGLGNNIAKDLLTDIANESGGRAYFPPSAKDLKDVYQRIAKELRSQYVLEYSSTNRTRDGNWRNLQITVPGEDSVVRTKKGFFAR